MRHKLIGTGLALIASLGACTTQKSIEPDAQLVVSDYTTKADLLAVDLGKRIAVALEDENFREFVGEELKKQFDGDDNFLVLKAEQDALGSKIGSFLGTLYPRETRSGRTSGTADLVENLEENYPLLQVAFPDLEVGDVSDWLANPQPVKVVVLPADYTETNGVTGAIAFDSEGNQTTVPLKEEPNEMVIVLTRNERTVGIPKETSNTARIMPPAEVCPQALSIAEPVYQTNSITYYNAYELEKICNPAPGDGGSGTPPPLINCSCDRQCNPNRKEMIAKVRFKTTTQLQWAEDWPLGKPEMRFVQMRNWDTSVASFTSATFTDGKRKDWKDGKWLTMNRQFNYWNLADNGDTEAYFVFEEDDVWWQNYSKTYTLVSKINGTNIIVEDTWESNTGLSAKDCGETDVFFCDNTTPPTVYTLDNFEFELTQH